MRLNAIRLKRYYRAAHFAYELSGPNNQTKQFYFRAFVDFAGGINPGGMTVYVDEYLQIGSQMHQMRDRNNNLIFPSAVNDTGAVFEVTSCLPVLDMFGNQSGFRAGLSRISGQA